MPGTDGFSVLQRILRRRPQQAVIVLSCLTDTRSKVRCLEMGAEDYLAKPFALDELLARVKARIRTRSSSIPRCSKRAACCSTRFGRRRTPVWGRCR